MMLLGNYNLIVSILLLFLETGIYLQLIGLMLFNLAIYTLISKLSFRNSANYFLLSSLSLLLIVFGYTFQLNNRNIFLLLIICSVFFKLNCYPFTSWIIPIYKSIKMSTVILIIILTKILFLILFSKFYYFPSLFPYIFILLIFGSLVSYNSDSIIELIIYSGSMQIIFIIYPIFNNNFILFFLYSLFYFSSLYALYLSLFYNINLDLRYFLLPTSIYMLIGIPPFIGFFSKLFVLFDLSILSQFSYIFFIFTFIIATILISYMYFKFLHSNLKYNIRSYNSITLFLYFISVLFIILPLYFNDFIF